MDRKTGSFPFTTLLSERSSLYEDSLGGGSKNLWCLHLPLPKNKNGSLAYQSILRGDSSIPPFILFSSRGLIKIWKSLCSAGNVWEVLGVRHKLPEDVPYILCWWNCYPKGLAVVLPVSKNPSFPQMDRSLTWKVYRLASLDPVDN